jgi:hypothetical protein
LDLIHSESANELKVWSAELTVVLRDDQERLMRAAGFDSVNFYGTFGFEAYDKQASDLLIAVARASSSGQ